MNKSENEVWKTHPEFDFIQASNLGRVRTVDRTVSNGKGMYVKKGRILKPQLNNYGYLYIAFGENGKFIQRKVHRVIAQTFIPNPDGWAEVNHKDNDRTNNCVDNLEWCTRAYNRQYREKHGVSQTEACGHAVFTINLNAHEVSRFPSQHEAARQLGVRQGNISRVLKGKQNQTGGYWFTKADDNAVENTRAQFGDEVASKVEQLTGEKEL
ncbi:HNH homing endonuclease [Lactobacillus phage Maenad]|uniref:HNH homing endonuclease n=1 Tax=Lactobacillus phage Maenad TaxID=2079431 RepID=A0A2P0ZKX9_9CAUD|nr:HNH endonuclease [Lactobacillus phage Maenad]AVH85645.1 HNH homing endonuclease [Lactobacillus phage Maenad]